MWYYMTGNELAYIQFFVFFFFFVCVLKSILNENKYKNTNKNGWRDHFYCMYGLKQKK